MRGHWTPTGAEPIDQWMDGVSYKLHIEQDFIWTSIIKDYKGIVMLIMIIIIWTNVYSPPQKNWPSAHSDGGWTAK